MDGAGGGVKMYSGAIDCGQKLVKAEGTSALFKGLPPALLRQSTYGSLRYGLYGPIRNSLGACAQMLWRRGAGPASALTVALRMVRSRTSSHPTGSRTTPLQKHSRSPRHHPVLTTPRAPAPPASPTRTPTARNILEHSHSLSTARRACAA